MDSYLFNEIKSEQLRTPTQRGFSLKQWEKTYNKIKPGPTAKDLNLFRSAKVIYSLLEDIRKELSALHKDQAPKITNDQLLMAFLAISNRDQHLCSKYYPEKKATFIA